MKKQSKLYTDYESLIKVGAMMGSGGLVVMDEDTCMVDVAKFFMDFIQRESCGKCIPCREGTYQVVRLLDRIQKGEGKKADLDEIIDLCGVVRQAAFCGLGQACVNPVISCIKNFRQEFEEHVEGSASCCAGGKG